MKRRRKLYYRISVCGEPWYVPQLKKWSLSTANYNTVSTYQTVMTFRKANRIAIGLVNKFGYDVEIERIFADKPLCQPFIYKGNRNVIGSRSISG